MSDKGIWRASKQLGLYASIFRVCLNARSFIQAQEDSAAIEGKAKPVSVTANSALKSASDLVYSVRVGAYLRRENAEKLFKTLVASGYDAYIKAAQGRTSELYYVEVGEFRDLSAADDTLKRLTQQGFSPIITYRKDEAAVPLTAQDADTTPALISKETKESAERSSQASKPDEEPAGNAPALGITAVAEASGRQEAQTASATDEPRSSGAFSLAKTLGATLLVLSLVIALFFVLRRWNPNVLARRSQEKLVHMLDSLALGERRAIALVEVGGDRYLVGATAQNISLLAKVDRQVGEGASVDSDFSRQISSKCSTPLRDGVKPREAQISELTSKLKAISKTLSL